MQPPVASESAGNMGASRSFRQAESFQSYRRAGVHSANVALHSGVIGLHWLELRQLSEGF